MATHSAVTGQASQEESPCIPYCITPEAIKPAPVWEVPISGSQQAFFCAAYGHSKEAGDPHDWWQGEQEAWMSLSSVVAKSASFEVTITDIARRSERRAWYVAFAASLMSLILAGGYFYFLPLKEKVPYLVMADAYTGTSTVARLRGDFSKNSITASEAINRSNVAHFILARESYDLAILKLRDWKTVYTMSGSEVATAYSTLYADSNPSSPYNLYGRKKAIRVNILSIVLIGGGMGVAPMGATLRFQRSLH